MELDILKRNINLHRLGICELSSDEIVIYQFLVDNLSNLKIHHYDDVFCRYKNDDYGTVFDFYINVKMVYCNIRLYDELRHILINIQSEHKIASTIIKWWIKINFNLETSSFTFGKYN